MAREPQFKASVMTSSLAFVSRELGEPALQSILGSFDSREIAGRQLLPSDWVREAAYRDFLLAIRRFLESTGSPRKTEDFLFEMGRYAAADGINRYYKPLIKVLDTKFLLTRTPHLWGVIHTHGTVKVEPTGKTGACIYIMDYPTPSREWCILVTGYIHAVIELSKARDIRLQQVECVMNGAKHCKFVAEWK